MLSFMFSDYTIRIHYVICYNNKNFQNYVTHDVKLFVQNVVVIFSLNNYFMKTGCFFLIIYIKKNI